MGEKNRFGLKFPSESWLIASANLFAVYIITIRLEIVIILWCSNTETLLFSLPSNIVVVKKFFGKNPSFFFRYWWFAIWSSRILSRFGCIWEYRFCKPKWKHGALLSLRRKTEGLNFPIHYSNCDQSAVKGRFCCAANHEKYIGKLQFAFFNWVTI